MKLLRIFGKFLISVGIGVLLFVAWVLWGTGIYTGQQQRALAEEFDSAPKLVGREVGQGFVSPPKGFSPDPGEGVFRLRIPSIELEHMVVEGVGTEELQKGPGHYPACRPGFPKPLCTEFEEVWPGERGRVVVSGHRTTYGAPFWDLDKVKPGDEILIDTRWSEETIVYEVTEKMIVSPNSPIVVIPSEKAELALTTCNPKFSAEQRLIVFAEMRMPLASATLDGYNAGGWIR